MRGIAALVGSLLLLAACGGDADEATPSSTSVTTTTEVAATTVAPTSTTVPSSTTTTTTTVPAPVCDADEMVAVLDAALGDVRLAPGGGWEPAGAATPFADVTAEPDEWAAALGLDCGARLTQTAGPADRLALVAWTGPRAAFVIRATDQPDPPPRSEALVSIGFEAARGEYVRDGQSLWVGVLASGETVAVGHLDFNLGVTAKTFGADAPPFGDPEISLPAEQVAIDLLTAVGARNVSIAQPPEFGSEEGYVAFVSPTGQILVVDVAPDGWFDPMRPRYYTGTTTMLEVDGTTVRVSEPAGEEGAYTVGVEVAWACAGHVWILEPTSNGTAEEMVAFVERFVTETGCELPAE